MRSFTSPDMTGRCTRCFLSLARCLCAEVVPATSRIDVVCVRHALERWKTTNTVRLAQIGLPALQIHDYGMPGPPFELPAFDPADTCLLYPDAAPGPLPAGIRRLVVLDGSWSQSKKMLARLAPLRGLPRLVLPPGPLRPRLRKEHLPEGMATIEAIAEALRVLDGDRVAEQLHGVHELFVRRVLAARGDTLEDLLALRHGAGERAASKSG